MLKAVISNTHSSMAAECLHYWGEDHAAKVPRLYGHGKTRWDRIWVLGVGARIMGANAAVLPGRIMARSIARVLKLPITRKHRAKSVTLTPDDLVAHINAPLVQKLLDIAKR